MSLLRWLSVALLTLAPAGALHAQTASFSVLGLGTLFGRETPAYRALSVLPRPALPTGNIITAALGFPGADNSEEAEELPAPQRGEINLLPAFVPECLKIWKEQ